MLLNANYGISALFFFYEKKNHDQSKVLHNSDSMTKYLYIFSHDLKKPTARARVGLSSMNQTLQPLPKQ